MAKQPNILLITTDQQRYDTLGCTGNPIIQTPHLDNLASRGVLFSDMHVQNPICAPSRACLATGRLPFATRVHANGSILPTSERTLMQHLAENDYTTAGFGKMHFRPQKAGLHHDSDRLPEQPAHYPYYGFQECRLTDDTRVGPYTEYLATHGIDHRVDIDSGDKGQWKVFTGSIPEEHHQTTWITDRTLDHLSGVDRKQPFFVWTSFVDPHHPFSVPPPFDSMYDPEQMPLPLQSAEEEARLSEAYRVLRYGLGDNHESVDFSAFTDQDWQRIKASYYGMVSLIDKNVGRILTALQQGDLLDNTIIVFTADHGEYLGDHGILFKSLSTYGCLTRVPFILSYPQALPTGESRSNLAQQIDLFPTLMELAGLDTPTGVQGKSLLPAINDPEQELYSEIYSEMADHPKIDPTRCLVTLRSKQWRYTYHVGNQYGELYDLQQDPDELVNLWNEDTHADLKHELMSRCLDRILLSRDPLPDKIAVW